MSKIDNNVFVIKQGFKYVYKKRSLFKEASAWELTIKKDVTIRPGFVAVLGESGAGKSTMVSILGGFEKLTKEQAQKIFYEHDGKTIDYFSKNFSKIKKDAFGYIFQRCYESKSLNAIDNVAMPLVNRNYPKSTIRSYCKTLLKSLNLDHLSGSPANELSGGQLTRIGILRGIAQTPAVLFADEPANNLDAQNAGRILYILQQWQKQTGGTVVMVTHHLNHAFKYADQIIVFKSKNNNSGEVVLDIRKKQKEWSVDEKKRIQNELKNKTKIKASFPDAPQKEKMSRRNRLNFLMKMSWKNIISKADGSRTISLITLAAFALLLFTIFSGNLFVQWFHNVDKLKNNDAFLRRFKIQVLTEPGLNDSMQETINNIELGDLRKWLIKKIATQLCDLESKCKQNQYQQPIPVVFSNQFIPDYSNKKQLCKFLMHKLSTISEMSHLSNLSSRFKSYSNDISILIQKNKSIETFNRKIIRQIEQQAKSIDRYFDFLSDIFSLSDHQTVCSVYPQWEAGPEFVKKNGERRNLTTTIRWLDYRDPFFSDPRLNYINGANFRFKSNDDEGIIIDLETLVDDLGYSVNDKEVHIIYGTSEVTCVPVRAVVESMPEKDRYHAITTMGFGEKIRAFNHHCKENRKYFQALITFQQPVEENSIKSILQHHNNFDGSNKIYDYALASNKEIEIYADYDYALTESGWSEWTKKTFSNLSIPFSTKYKNDWEVPVAQLKDPPYDRGTVYTHSANVVRALGEYLSVGMNELKNIDDRCRINAHGYEEKIQFSKQTQSLISWFRIIGIFLFGFLFIIFLVTDMMITIRNKAAEIAIFQAMGGSLLGLLLIYNTQMFIVIFFAAIIAFTGVLIVKSFIHQFFIDNIILSLWKSIEEQREAIVEISTDSMWETIVFIFQANQPILLTCLGIMIVTVSSMIIYVKISDNYSVSKVLKER
jgi:putative ABC transport system ATP-binding protein